MKLKDRLILTLATGAAIAYFAKTVISCTIN